MNNTQRITAVSFLTYFVLSAMLSPIGIISTPMAEHFDQPVTEATKQFSWLTGGNLIGAVIALVIFDFVSLRRLFMAIYGTVALALLSLYFVDSLTQTRWVLGLVGLGSGIGLAGAAVTISRTYADEQRASMLVITDGCFSIAGFLTAWIATWLITQSFGWSTTYQLLAIVAATIFMLTLTSDFPVTTREAEPDDTLEVSPWPVGVWLCVISLFLYTLGQYSMLFWLPNYASTALGATQAEGGALVGQFWLGMFFAQLFVAWWVYKIGVPRLVTIASVTTGIGSISLWTVTDLESLTFLALAWGFMNLSMLKGILSFATQMVQVPSPRLVSLLLLGATSGTAISPFLTSQIVEWTDNHTILMFASGCYLVLFMLMLAARMLYARLQSVDPIRN